jgi:hypothetical protein
MLLMRIGAEVKVVGVVISGQEYAIPQDPAATGTWSLRYNALPPEGAEIELRIETSGPVDCWLADRSLGLPQALASAHRLRPDDMMAKYGSDVTLVTRRYRF